MDIDKYLDDIERKINPEMLPEGMTATIICPTCSNVEVNFNDLTDEALIAFNHHVLNCKG